jgi:hypothetical protein
VKFKIRCSKVCSVWCQCFFNFVLSPVGGQSNIFSGYVLYSTFTLLRSLTPRRLTS